MALKERRKSTGPPTLAGSVCTGDLDGLDTVRGDAGGIGALGVIPKAGDAGGTEAFAGTAGREDFASVAAGAVAPKAPPNANPPVVVAGAVEAAVVAGAVGAVVVVLGGPNENPDDAFKLSAAGVDPNKEDEAGLANAEVADELTAGTTTTPAAEG